MAAISFVCITVNAAVSADRPPGEPPAGGPSPRAPHGRLPAGLIGRCRSSPGARSPGESAYPVQQRQYLPDSLPHQGLVAPALDVQPNHRLRVRRPQIEAPVRELKAYAVRLVYVLRIGCV